MPAFVKFIDDQEEEIAAFENGKKEGSGFRLAVLVYLLGLTIHQSVDGNTQSANIISLSYIHQFCPDYKENFFPIKYISNNDSDDYLKVPFPDFDSTLPPDLSDKHREDFERFVFQK